ncbi:MAG: hypothetical protein DMD81_23260 [Candidatus Rokuibacteriota bacterium]|nr:MAG: hypothetical protein DMD81_23260 [Candidatus Rokubacteria bacterium]
MTDPAEEFTITALAEGIRRRRSKRRARASIGSLGSIRDCAPSSRWTPTARLRTQALSKPS